MKIPAWRGLVLKNKQVPEMSIQLRSKLVTDPREKSVLIEVIVNDVLSGVDVNFITKKQKRCFRFQRSSLEGNGERKVIAKPPVKNVFSRKFTILNLSPETLLNAKSLRNVKTLSLLQPLQLLPRPVFWNISDSLLTITGSISVPGSNANLVARIVDVTDTDDGKGFFFYELIGPPEVHISPNARFRCKTRLIKVSDPRLFSFPDLFL